MNFQRQFGKENYVTARASSQGQSGWPGTVNHSAATIFHFNFQQGGAYDLNFNFRGDLGYRNDRPSTSPFGPQYQQPRNNNASNSLSIGDLSSPYSSASRCPPSITVSPNGMTTAGNAASSVTAGQMYGPRPVTTLQLQPPPGPSGLPKSGTSRFTF